ncbi:MAG: hypothetical protein ACLVJB_08275 [Christensenellales bacterium]
MRRIFWPKESTQSVKQLEKSRFFASFSFISGPLAAPRRKKVLNVKSRVAGFPDHGKAEAVNILIPGGKVFVEILTNCVHDKSSFRNMQ